MCLLRLKSHREEEVEVEVALGLQDVAEAPPTASSSILMLFQMGTLQLLLSTAAESKQMESTAPPKAEAGVVVERTLAEELLVAEVHLAVAAHPPIRRQHNSQHRSHLQQKVYPMDEEVGRYWLSLH